MLHFCKHNAQNKCTYCCVNVPEEAERKGQYLIKILIDEFHCRCNNENDIFMEMLPNSPVQCFSELLNGEKCCGSQFVYEKLFQALLVFCRICMTIAII